MKEIQFLYDHVTNKFYYIKLNFYVILNKIIWDEFTLRIEEEPIKIN